MEQENLSRKKIDEILSSNDLYKIVGASPGASKSDLKKAYYKSSLLVHPDKTKEKGAAEAFVKLSNAYEDLCEGRKTSQPNPQAKPKKAPKKRTTEAGSFDEIFRNFFQKKTVYVSRAEQQKNDAAILKWYYKQNK